MEFFFNFIFSIIEHFNQDGYRILLFVSFLILIYKYWFLFLKEKILISISIFIIYGIILTCFCDNKDLAFKEITNCFLGWICAFFLGYSVKDKKKNSALIKITIFVFVLTVFLGFLSYFGLLPEKIYFFRLRQYNQIKVGTTSRLIFAARCLIVSIILISYILFKKEISKQKTFIAIFLILFFSMALFLSGSRVYYFVYFITLLSISIFFFVKTKSLKQIIMFFSIIFILCGIAYSTNKQIAKRIKNISITKDVSISSRINMHKFAIKLIKQYPVFGVGPAQATTQEDFFKLKLDNHDHPHLHSVYLDTAAEYGIIGLILFLIIMFYVFKNLILQYRKDNDFFTLALIFIWFALLLGDFFNLTIFRPFAISLCFWFTGLTLSKPKKEKS